MSHVTKIISYDSSISSTLQQSDVTMSEPDMIIVHIRISHVLFQILTWHEWAIDIVASANHALIVHAGGDTYSDTPPLGGGGARVACGVAN